eukprot:s5128_g12.t1
MAPQAKRSREMEEEEEEIWMDQDLGLDEETIRRIMRILIRSAIRHEPQLTILEADRSYAFFMETNSHGIIGLLTQASTMWHQKFEEGTVAETAGWATRTPLQWIYNEWNPEQKKALPSSRDNLPREDAKKAVAQLIKNTAKDGTVHRFQSLKPLKQDMILTLTVHQHAAEVYRDLDLLENNCAGKLIGLRLRKERVSKSALAKELERLQL